MARAPLATEIEALPEADRLDDFPHPRETRGLFGQDVAQATLSEALASGRMHHAWLLSGPAGIGKATLAYQFARAALARPEERDLFGQGMAIEPNSPTDRQVRVLSHPGLLVIRRTCDPKTKRFSQTIAVDEVRRLRSFLALSPEEQGWRVVIVDSADDLNANAANASMASVPGCVVRPAETAGPYFVDEKLNRSDIRSDPSDGSVREGAPLELTFNVSQLAKGACAPLAGSTFYGWGGPGAVCRSIQTVMLRCDGIPRRRRRA